MNLDSWRTMTKGLFLEEQLSSFDELTRDVQKNNL